MAEYSEEFLKKTVKVWQPYYQEPLTLEDAREIAANMTALYRYLHELDKKYGREEEKKKS